MDHDYESIFNEYSKKYPLYQKTAISLNEHLKEYLNNFSRIDRIDVRAKLPERFTKKALKYENGDLKYLKPFEEIQDQIGARIITYYLSDVEKITDIINSYYDEIEMKIKEPDSYKEFSYFGKHFILFIPDEINSNGLLFFELQIKTLFQHAWSEAEHDLNYKSKEELSFEDKRYIAFSSAQAWGADKIFDELFCKYN